MVKVIFCHCDDRSELPRATLGFLPLSSTHGIDTHKFHGSFRICFRLFCTFCIVHIKIAYLRTLPYRYFNEPLVLYSDFSDSRQISLLRISIAVGGLSHHELNGLFLHRKRLLITDHKDSAFNFSMMIHCKELLMVSIFSTRITSSGKNQLIQYLEQAYLVTIASRHD